MVLTNWLINLGGGHVGVVYGYKKTGIDRFTVYSRAERRYMERVVTGKGLRAILGEVINATVAGGLA